MRLRSLFNRVLAVVITASFLLADNAAYIIPVHAETIEGEDLILQEQGEGEITLPEEAVQVPVEHVDETPGASEDGYEIQEETVYTDESVSEDRNEDMTFETEGDLTDMFSEASEDEGGVPAEDFDAPADPQTENEEDDEEERLCGYIEMPWDNNTPVVPDHLDFDEAKNEIVIDRGPERGRYIEEPESVPSRFPYENITEDVDILSYLKNTYPSTRTQSPYGTCWAHSAIALSEFYMINHDLADQDGPVDKSVDYSELQLAYFCYNKTPAQAAGDTGDNVSYIKTTKNFLDYGGNIGYAAQTMMKYNGVTEDLDDAAYSNADNVVENGLADEYAFSRDVVHLKNEYQINIKDNPKLVKQAIIENGIVGVSYYSNRNYYYESGNAYFNNYNRGTNHAVAIVGWDDDFPVDRFNPNRHPDNPGAWLVRNSWDTAASLSYNSYFWMSYEDSSLNSTAYVFEMASPDEYYDNNYNYDSQLHSTNDAPGSKVANVFTVRGNKAEILKAVQIDESASSNVRYTIRIYRGLSNASDPESGTEVTEAGTEGTLPFAGRYTIPLSSPVELNGGETFAVVVETEGKARIDVEKKYSWVDSDHNTVLMEPKINPKESFYFDSGENKWVDLSDINRGTGNLCIRALTNNEAPSLPEEIENLSVRNITESAATIEWSRACDVEGYEIWCSISENDPAPKIVSVSSAARKYTITGLEAESTYYFKVYPVRNDKRDDSGASDEVLATTLPGKPQITVYDVGSYSAKVSWKALTDCEFYELRYYLKGSNRYYYRTLGRATTGCRIMTLTPGETFCIKLAKYSGDRKTIKSTDFCTPVEITTNNTIGTAVTNLKASAIASGKTIRLTWDKSADASFYNVEIGKGSLDFEKDPEDYTTNYYNYTVPDEEIDYYFRVTAVYRKYDTDDVDEAVSEIISYPDNAPRQMPDKSLFTVANENVTYDGSEHPMSVTSMAEEIDVNDIDVEYAVLEDDYAGAYSTVAPKDAGTYRIRLLTPRTQNYIAAEIEDAAWDFTIFPKAVTLQWDNTGFTYDGKPHGPVAAAGNVITGDSCSVSVTGEATNAGTYTARAVSVSNGNYSLPADKTKNFTISKANTGPSDITKMPAARKLAYNGTSMQLITAGTVKAKTGTLVYALGNSASSVPSGGYSAAVPSASNAGTYYVWYKIKGGANHNDSTAKCITVSVAKNSGALSVVLGKNSYKYDGKTKTPSVTVKCGGKTLTANRDYKVTMPSKRVKVGTYKVSVAGIGNYSGKGSATFRIGKAANTMNITGKTAQVKYKNLKTKKQTLAVSKIMTVKNAKGKVSYKKGSGNSKIKIDTKTGKVTISKGLGKGSYKVKVKVTAAGDDNYSGVTKAVTVTIKVK